MFLRGHRKLELLHAQLPGDGGKALNEGLVRSGAWKESREQPVRLRKPTRSSSALAALTVVQAPPARITSTRQANAKGSLGLNTATRSRAGALCRDAVRDVVQLAVSEQNLAIGADEGGLVRRDHRASVDVVRQEHLQSAFS